MNEQQTLQQQIEIAQAVLSVLEQQVADLGTAEVPHHLQMGLVYKRRSVQSLEVRLAQIQGQTPALPNNLPQCEPIFVGRGHEIAMGLETLEPDDRGWGIIIDGIGGLGKTSLAVELAHKVAQRAWFDAYVFASAKTTWLTDEGVRRESLALSSLDAFIREFARLLGHNRIAQITDAKTCRQAMWDAMQGRQVLFIWDNLETLDDEECDLILDFLRKMPSPNKAIVTTRRRSQGGVLTIHLDRLAPREALALMVEVGHRQPRVAMALAQTEEATRLALYEATGGNPLALHWTLGLVAQEAYTISQALERLRDVSRSPDLYAFLFATSVRSLPGQSRAVLSALATFHTSATIESLTEATELSETDIRLALERLVTLAIVHQLEGEQYSIHPLARTYIQSAVRQELRDSGSNTSGMMRLDAEAYRLALRYWVGYAQRYGQEHYQTFHHLERAWPNLEAAAATLYDWVRDPRMAGDRESGRLLIACANSLKSFCRFRGYWDEGVRLHTWAYQTARSLGEWKAAGWHAYDVARIYYHRVEKKRAAQWAERMTEAMMREGTRRDWAAATSLRGLIALQRGDFEEAERCSLEALEAARDLGEEKDQAVVLNDLGGIAGMRRDYARAESYFRQGLSLAEKVDDKNLHASTLGNLGLLAFTNDRLDDAYTWYTSQLTLAREIGQQSVVAIAQIGLARVLEQQGNYTEALRLAEEARQIGERLRDRMWREARQVIARLRKHMEH